VVAGLDKMTRAMKAKAKTPHADAQNAKPATIAKVILSINMGSV